jgi:hypothetical protein
MPLFLGVNQLFQHINIKAKQIKQKQNNKNNKKLKFVFARKNVCLPPSHKL